MPALFVQTANSGSASGTPSTKAVTFASAQGAGNCNLVVISYGLGSGTVVPQTVVSVLDTLGNSYSALNSLKSCVGAGGTGAVGQIIYLANNIKAAGAGANTVTVTLSATANFFTVTLLEYSGIAFAALDVSAANSQNAPASTTGSTGPLTTINANDTLIGALCFFDGASGAPSSGFTQRASFYTTLVADQILGGIGTYTLSATGAGTSGWVAQMVGIKAAAAPTGHHWYVRPAGAGAQTGADWNNAWDIGAITWASVNPLDTVWLAGGTYLTQLIPTASGSAGSPINIYRVRATDPAPASAAGWNPSFDSQVVLSTTTWPQVFIKGPLSYLNIDGRIMSGILVQGGPTGGDNFRVGVAGGGNVDHLFVSHLELVNSASTSGLTFGRYSFNLVPGQYTASVLSNSTIDHCIIRQTCEAFRANGWNNVVVQYCQIHDTTLDNVDHNDLAYFSGTVASSIFRYNTFYNSPSNGVLFESNTAVTGFQFYGNVLYNCVLALVQTKSGTGTQQLDFYNNVFAGTDPAANSGFVSLQGTAGNCHFYDNIFYNCQNQASGITGVTSDYNAYYPSLVNGVSWPTAEPHSFLVTSQPFNNPAGGDFTLSAVALAANPKLGTGLALATDGFINFDMNGFQRLATSWTVGGFQSTQGSVSTTVARDEFNRGLYGTANLRVAAATGIGVGSVLTVAGNLTMRVSMRLPGNEFKCEITQMPRGDNRLLIREGDTVTG